MRKLTLSFIVLMIIGVAVFSTTGCTDKKSTSADSAAVDSKDVDSTSADTMNNIISDTPMPKAADELFDDFCETVGKNVIKKKTFLYWFNQFEKGKFDAKKK